MKDSGVVFFFVLLISLLVFGIFYSQKTNRYFLNLGLLAAAFVYIAYLSYAMVPIRSAANTSINMNAPVDPFSIKSYVDREQYGDRPLVYGPDYTATYQDISGTKEIGDRWFKGKDKYEFAGKKIDYTFKDGASMLFPRLGCWQETAKHDGYRTWLTPGVKLIDRKTDQVVQSCDNKARESGPCCFCSSVVCSGYGVRWLATALNAFVFAPDALDRQQQGASKAPANRRTPKVGEPPHCRRP